MAITYRRRGGRAEVLQQERSDFVETPKSQTTGEIARFSATYQTVCHGAKRHYAKGVSLGTCPQCGNAKVVAWIIKSMSDFDTTT